jgi:hypothetical protein
MHCWEFIGFQGGRNPRYTACPPLDAEGRQTFPMAQLQFDELVVRRIQATHKYLPPHRDCLGICCQRFIQLDMTCGAITSLSLLLYGQAKLSPATIMGGSEYWNGPTKAVYPSFVYCNRSVPSILASGCSTATTPPNECSDTHDAYGDTFRPVEITGSGTAHICAMLCRPFSP